MSGKFILSLDCEGKWGVADKLTAFHHRTLSDERLRICYRDLLALLSEYMVPATFAFVGTFTLTRSQFSHCSDALDSLSNQAPYYLAPALADLRVGSRQGWLADWAVDAVTSTKVNHEIGCHGVTHLPWSSAVTEDTARAEIALLERMPLIKDSKTYIFPRNKIAHLHLLAEHGFVGYRAAKSVSRLSSLASEFNVFSKPEPMLPKAHPTVIPAGYFVNWQSGLRKIVPASMTRFRAKRMLNKAAEENTIVHYWTHPENIASAPQTLDVLRSIIEEAARMREQGKIEIVTQYDYCNNLS